MATTRLRKTFQYPESDSDEPLEGIDEQDQEKLIADLHTEDESKSALYTLAFTVLTIAPIIFLLPSLIRPATALPTILSITSLLSTAYTLHFLPLSSPSSARDQNRRSTPRSPLSTPATLYDRFAVDPDSPLGKYLVPLNAGLAGVLALWALAVKSRREDWSVLLLPAFMFSLILLVRSTLKPVDVDSLERLRYRYKGA